MFPVPGCEEDAAVAAKGDGKTSRVLFHKKPEIGLRVKKGFGTAHKKKRSVFVSGNI